MNTVPLSITGRAAALLLMWFSAAAGAESVERIYSPQAAGAAAPAQVSAAGRIDFAIRISEVLQINVLAQPAHLDVTPDDIARGYVESQSTVQIFSNSRQGFAVRVDVLDALISGGEVLGLGDALHLVRDGASGRASHDGKADKRVTYEVRYRLQLAPGGTPGRYRWPLRIGVNG